MPTMLTQDQVQILGKNISTNMNTILGVLRGFEIKEGMKTEVKQTNAQIILLGCIAVAINTLADLQFCQAEKASILVPN